MHLFKSSVLFFTFILSSNLLAFSTNECLKNDFNVQVDHKGFPFGLMDVKLGIDKSGCNITVRHQKYKYLNSQWDIDVCRGPVHIKKGSGAVEVIKKVNNCSSASKDDFCVELKDMSMTIQDDGLIFAEGIKEDISSHHGKVYCSFLLLQRYLNDSIVFNSGSEYDDNLESLKGAKVKKNKNDEVAPRPVMEGAESSEETPAEVVAPTGEGSF